MYYNGFLKVALVTPPIEVGMPMLNAKEITKHLNKLKTAIALFPELVLSGYTAQDLFFRQDFLAENLQALKYIIDNTTYEGIFIIGLPLNISGITYNVAAVCSNKKVLGVIPKYYLPNYREFSEKRWFESGLNANFETVELFNESIPFGKILFKDEINDITLGVEVCQDMWTINTPGDDLALMGAQIILNLSASTEYVGKPELRRTTIKDSSRRQNSIYLYTSGSSLESSTDVVFSNHKIVAELGKITSESSMLDNEEVLISDVDLEKLRYSRRIDSSYRDQVDNFNGSSNQRINIVKINIKNDSNYKLTKKLDKQPFVCKTKEDFEIANLVQVSGLYKKLLNFKDPKIVVGISGGIDSTLALLVAHQTFNKLGVSLKNIIAVNMPSKNSRKVTQEYAIKLIDALGVSKVVQPIDELVEKHLLELEHEEKDVTYENAQARIRTLNLMNLAGKNNAIVLGTGDLSEISLGWMTYNADHMSMYNPNSGVPKTLAQALIKYHSENKYQNISKLLLDILSMPISPELLKEQTTEDSIGSYEINDFILHHLLAGGKDKNSLIWLVNQIFDLSIKESEHYVERFISRFYSQQYKRQVMPEGPKVIHLSLSPRSELRLPSDLKRK